MAGERTPLSQVAAQLGLVLLFAGIGAVVVLAAPLWPLIFGAVLLAVLLRGCSDWLSRKFRGLSPGLAYALVCFVALGLMALALALVLPTVVEQLSELIDRLPDFLGRASGALEGFLGRGLASGVKGKSAEEISHAAATVLGTSTTALAGLVVVMVTGIYLGVDPHLYLQGVLRLVPVARRGRSEEVLREVGHTLFRFLGGRLVSMLAVGVLTALGLKLIGVSFAVTLGVVAGLLTFVPYAGPLVSTLPIALAAGLDDLKVLALTLAFYALVQWVEGFVITPLVQQRLVRLAPALTLVAELCLGFLFGPLGVVISVPFAAGAQTFVRMVYVEGVLEARRPS